VAPQAYASPHWFAWIHAGLGDGGIRLCPAGDDECRSFPVFLLKNEHYYNVSSVSFEKPTLLQHFER